MKQLKKKKETVDKTVENLVRAMAKEMVEETKEEKVHSLVFEQTMFGKWHQFG